MTPTDVLVLDFDGVLCDSAEETGVSAWRAGQQFFADWAGAMPPADFLAAFVAVRPVLETGYQAILLMRRIADGVPVDQIRAEGAAAAEALMPQLSLDKSALVKAFGSTRDAWIASDVASWLACHRFYPGTLERMREKQAAGCPLLISTTKQERFVVALLAGQGIGLPAESILGLDSGKKKEQVLREALAAYPGSRIHFVEDRLDTLRRVEERPELDAIRLYYADWGYGLPAELAAAQADPRLRVWSLDQFLNLAD